MRLSDILDIRTGDVVSIVGGGGKTSTMFTLARELKDKGKKVLVTTTTAIMMPEKSEYDFFIDKSKGDDIGQVSKENGKGIYVYIGNFIRSDKLKGISEDEVDLIHDKSYFDYILVEADGAKRKPIKAPRDGEPLIPRSTSIVIGVIGLDCLEKVISEENVHRVGLFCQLTQSREGEKITPELVYRLISHKEGLLKGSEGKRRYLILNKADNKELLESGRQIKSYIAEEDNIGEIMIASLKNGEIYL